MAQQIFRGFGFSAKNNVKLTPYSVIFAENSYAKTL